VYPGLRDHRRWVLPEVLAFQAGVQPDRTYAAMVDGDTLTYGAAAADAARVAGFLSDLGIGPRDRVAALLPNGLDFVRLWLGAGRLGATLVPLNIDLKGAFLEHQLRDSAARLVVVDTTLLDGVAAIAPAISGLERIVVAGSAGADGHIGFERWRAAAAHDGPLPSSRDIACIMYTSGTTGPSKGVLMPHAHCYLFGLGTIDSQNLTPQDRLYVSTPLFHANGLFMQLYATLIAGASAVVRPRFSAGSWLADVRGFLVTSTNLLGAMTAFIFAQPASAADADHRLRVIQTAPNDPAHEAVWHRRFGVAEVLSGYGMTEVNIPIYGMIGRARPGTSGRVYERYFQVEVRDPETDDPVPAGQVGEIMVRPKVPFGFMAGYNGVPEKTLEAWRNFWFHTGDAGVMDHDGYFAFIDRMKDCIRRRGENISSFEVESALLRLDGVKEVAAFAVPADTPAGEDEVMLAVVPHPGATLTAEAVARFADGVLPRFARPRYVEILDELPKTPTEKVRKEALRRRAVTASTWDRERMGPRHSPGSPSADARTASRTPA